MQEFDVFIAKLYGVDVAVMKEVLTKLNFPLAKEILRKESTCLAVFEIAPYWSTAKIKTILKKIEGIRF